MYTAAVVFCNSFDLFQYIFNNVSNLFLLTNVFTCSSGFLLHFHFQQLPLPVLEFWSPGILRSWNVRMLED